MVASSSSSSVLRIREGDPTNQPYLQQPQLRPQSQPQLRLQPQPQQQHTFATPSSSSLASTPQSKKKRNLPGAPSKYPDAEVILLSPKTLMATNRFICEVCNKGFQREQNLQLHRRGHNLPWKLRQKSNKDQVRKKVYLCPEPTCVHHDPARALGDLTGIKKHFSRKHGEKKFKCDKCSKRYAVQSDWKAHSKTCGTREYRCDCGTLFSRRDSFITHRAFCDALAQESARHPAANLTTLGSHLFGAAGGGATTNNMNLGRGLSQLHNSLPSLSDQTTAEIMRLRPSQFDNLLSPTSFRPDQQSLPSPSAPGFYLTDHHQVAGGSQQGGIGGGSSGAFMTNENQSQGGVFSNKLFTGQLGQLPDLHGSSNPFNLSFYSNDETITTTNNPNANSNADFFGRPQMSTSLYSTGLASSTSGGPHMSATALLQKATQIGSTTSASNASATALLKGFPPSSSSSSSPKPSPPSSAGFGGIFVDQNEQSNLHDIMNSLTSNGGPWASPLGDNNNTITTTTNNNNIPAQQGVSGPRTGYNPNKSVMGSSSDGMTRDFLGVGEIVRSINGGFGPQQQGMNNASSSGGATASSNNTNNNKNQQGFGNESGDHHHGSFR